MPGQSSNNRRIIAAPAPSHPDLRSTILNVHCAEDEDVEWQWTDCRRPLRLWVSPRAAKAVGLNEGMSKLSLNLRQ